MNNLIDFLEPQEKSGDKLTARLKDDDVFIGPRNKYINILLDDLDLISSKLNLLEQKQFGLDHFKNFIDDTFGPKSDTKLAMNPIGFDYGLLLSFLCLQGKIYSKSYHTYSLVDEGSYNPGVWFYDNVVDRLFSQLSFKITDHQYQKFININREAAPILSAFLNDNVTSLSFIKRIKSKHSLLKSLHRELISYKDGEKAFLLEDLDRYCKLQFLYQILFNAAKLTHISFLNLYLNSYINPNSLNEIIDALLYRFLCNRYSLNEDGGFNLIMENEEINLSFNFPEERSCLEKILSKNINDVLDTLK